jgi:hypothetical protein
MLAQHPRIESRMNAGKEKPSTTDEQVALAIGERLLNLHPFMQIKHVDVIDDGVVLVERVGVGLFSYSQNSIAKTEMQEMAETWQAVGIVLGVFIFAIFVAVITRLFSAHKIEGQTFSMVVLGVAGVVGIAGFRIGWDNVGFLSLCFSVAALPMAIEYYSRFISEQIKANKEAEKLIDGNSSTSG